MSENRRDWEWIETLAAFNLYCKMPPNKINKRDKEIITLAKKLNRTPRSLEMKMKNLQWHDPDNQRLDPDDRKGYRNGSKLDKNIWKEFFDNPKKIMCEIEQARAYFDDKRKREIADEEHKIKIPELEERQQIVQVRVHQDFFRTEVLLSYDKKCCISGLATEELLIASHIKPWREKQGRLDPRNGLCLNALYDRAFDRGLITIFPGGKIAVSEYLLKQANECDESALIASYAGKKIRMPHRFKPKKEFLEYHNKKIYKR